MLQAASLSINHCLPSSRVQPASQCPTHLPAHPLNLYFGCFTCFSFPHSIYTLLRIVNVEKRRDTARGNRYLLELELAERGQRTVRLSEYVYVLLHQGKQDDSAEANPEGPALGATEAQPSTWSILYGKPILCRPLQLSWKQDIMVHFVVPGR